MKKKLLFLVPVIAIVAAGAYYSWRGIMMRRAADEVVLPDFAELGPGPRAPTTALLGVEVGKSTFDDVKGLASARGLDCKDTSARALMKQMRAMKKKEREEKMAQGIEVDATSSASAKKKSPMEKNPQVRYSCEDTKAAQLADRERDGVGRVLFVLDSPEHPVRHASYRRNHKTSQAAWHDAKATLDALTKTYGEPKMVKRPLPDAPSADAFPLYTQSRYAWEFADLKVMLDVMGTPRGVNVHEAVEVPWPVRSDAPALAHLSE
ncbi:MAG: hypothetical protein RMA76_33980 [Deltaproteobacteria bacterium]|jgi:hypothetical protein